MPRLPVPFVGIGVVQGAVLVAGILFHSYVPEYRSIEISMAADTPKWASRTRIGLILGYPFRQLGCQRVTTAIKASNDRAIRFNEGLGFQHEGVMKLGYGDEDCVILGLMRTDWENSRYGQ